MLYLLLSPFAVETHRLAKITQGGAEVSRADDRPITARGFPFSFDPSACEACGGGCCSGESGNVWLSPQELDAIAEALGRSPFEVSLELTHRVGGRLSLRERYHPELGSICRLFDPGAGGCTVYDARPQQCRTYPFWPAYRKRGPDDCPGVRPYDGES